MPHATETLNSSTGSASVLSSLPISIPNSLYAHDISTSLEQSVSSNSYSDYVHNSLPCSADDNSNVGHDQDLYFSYSTDSVNFTPSSDSQLKVLEATHCRDNICCNKDHGNLHDLLQHIDLTHPRLKVIDGVIFPFETSTIYTQSDNGLPTFNTTPIGFVHSSVTNSSPHSPSHHSKSSLNLSEDINFNTYINDTPPSSIIGKQKWCSISQNLGQENGSQDDKSCESDTNFHFPYQFSMMCENKNALYPSRNFSIDEPTYVREASNSSSISNSYNDDSAMSGPFQINADQDPLLSVQSPSISYPSTPVEMIDTTDSSTFLRSATSSPTNLGDFSTFSVLDNQTSMLISSPPSAPNNISLQRPQSMITKSNNTTNSHNYGSFNISDYTPYVSQLNGPSSISQSDQRRRSSTTILNSNGSNTNTSTPQQNFNSMGMSPNIKSSNQRRSSSATISITNINAGNNNQRRGSSDSNLLIQQTSFMSNFVSSQRSDAIVDPNLLVSQRSTYVEMNDFMSANTNYLHGDNTTPNPNKSSTYTSMIVQTNSTSTKSNDARGPCKPGSFQKATSPTDNTSMGSYLPPVSTTSYPTDGYSMVGFVSSGSTNSGLVRILPKTSTGMVAMADIYADPALTSADGFLQGKKFPKKRIISADTRSCKRRVSKSLETSNISSVT
ncbi:9108_t:CDS:2, partial [Scutellospora calospora]